MSSEFFFNIPNLPEQMWSRFVHSARSYAELSAQGRDWEAGKPLADMSDMFSAALGG